ncbi:hypothetical protein H7F15_07990 [Pontibacter sp. Tf4]|uniref:hypothetical protein n=1 Tax=Pontibacter sp. Tf4 TaxID=2761620 RepID=UPI00162424B3|nr:hypothetical protein [Pontibacter sp. Tf4]MBB6610973.1 hypothetical protein [Pontibacter sp. Tf4]
MANQHDAKIEDFASDYLKKHYTQQCSLSNILVSHSEKTRRGAKADGILVFKKDLNEVFVASVSMEQASALTTLLVNFKKQGLGLLRFVTPLLVAAGCFLLGKSINNLLVMLVAPVIVAPLAFMLHSYLQKKFYIRQVEKILDNVRSIPADEHWIGLSVSSLVFRKNQLANILLSLCAEKGIGLITVGQRAKVVLMHKPDRTNCRRSDFLTYYESEENIRKAVLGDHVLRVA